MNTDGNNLVNLDQWKDAKKRETNFSEYLKVLSFDDLMHESNHLVNEIKKTSDISNVLVQTKEMMNEFTSRLEKESKHLAETVRELKKQIEDKLH